MKGVRLAVILTCMALAMVVTSIKADMVQAEEITLYWASFLPKNHPETKDVQKYYMDRINERAKGQLVIKYRGGPEVIAPPNLGTLTLLSQFENPALQPVIRNTKCWKKIYDGVVAGNCVAGVLPIANLNKYDPSRANSRTIYTHRALPNQAFSAGPRLTREEQIKISRALVAPEAKEPTSKLRAAYRVGNSFITASNEEYLGVSEYLKNEWGYY